MTSLLLALADSRSAVTGTGLRELIIVLLLLLLGAVGAVQLIVLSAWSSFLLFAGGLCE
jgi:hypothetical protein